MSVASLTSSSTSSTSSPFMAIESPDIRSYTEMTKRIPDEDMKKIEEKMESLPSFDFELNRIEGLLETGKYNELPEDTFYYVLRGLKEGKTLAKRVARVSDIETLRLQGVNFQVHDLLEFAKDRDTMYRATGRNLSGDRLEAFIKELKELPPEDRFVMVFTPKNSKEKTEKVKKQVAIHSSLVTVSQVIESKQKINVFNRLKREGKYKRMSASLEVFEAFLKVRFNNDHAKANPVLGKSTFEQIEANGHTHTRDVCLLYVVPEGDKNKLVKYKRADRFKVKENDFNFHDRYHQLSASSIGSEARQLAATIAHNFKEEFLNNGTNLTDFENLDKFLNNKTSPNNDTNPTDRQALNDLHEILVDMDYAAGFSDEMILQRNKEKPLQKADKQEDILKLQNEEKCTAYPHSVPLMLSRLAKSCMNVLLFKNIASRGTVPRFSTQEKVTEVFSWIMNQIPEDEVYYKKAVAKNTISDLEKGDDRFSEQIDALITFFKEIFLIQN